MATRYTLYERKDDPNGAGNSRKNLRGSVEASLERLGTDYVVLLWVYSWDFLTPALEITPSDDQLARLAGVSAPPAELPDFPHDMYRDETVQQLLYGGTRGRIDDHRGRLP